MLELMSDLQDYLYYFQYIFLPISDQFPSIFDSRFFRINFRKIFQNLEFPESIEMFVSIEIYCCHSSLVLMYCQLFVFYLFQSEFGKSQSRRSRRKSPLAQLHRAVVVVLDIYISTRHTGF